MSQHSDQRHCPHVNDEEESFWCCTCERAITEGWACQNPGPCRDDTRESFEEFHWHTCDRCDQVHVVCRRGPLGCVSLQSRCKSCAVTEHANRLRADTTAKVILEQARKFKSDSPAEWAEMMAAADAGTGLSDAEARELLSAVEEAEVEALRRMVEGEA